MPKKDTNTKKRITAAEKRYSEALVYLNNKGVEHQSRVESYWMKSLEIASGFYPEENE